MSARSRDEGGNRPPPSGDGIAPTLAELIALKALAQRRPPARRGRHGPAGPAQSHLRGRGMEYAESREYVAGDDVRHIDWRLTARSGRTHTKLFQAERERLTLIVADTAPSLYFGTRVRFKSVQAARAGALAAWAAVAEGDRVAILRGSLREPPVRPASGMRGALRVLDALVRWYRQPPADDAGLSVALDHAGRLLRPGSRLLVLADPRSVTGVPAMRWSALAAHHTVLVAMPTDALEREPPQALLPFAVAGERIELDMADPRQRQAWLAAFERPVQDALAQLPRRGVRAVALPAESEGHEWLPLFNGAAQPQVA
ncbi:DUF58 domain-containing protein [Pseudoxanthomonas mexicana]|uniref:DUF58 domain-containing protein n=1 Tax=Pseudoxanthomonas mexicana TaxID=128785 RepID=UPI00398B86E9